MTETTELHAAIAQMQVLMTQAAEVIEHNTKSLAESHERDGVITDTEVQASIESDTDLVAHLRAAALPWDQRHKPAQDVPEVKFGDMAEQPAVQQERVAIARDSLAAIAQIILDGNSEDENQAQREQWAVDKIQTALSAQPAQRKPLTTKEIREWWASENGFEDCNMSKLDDFEQVVRAIESKHGIKENT